MMMPHAALVHHPPQVHDACVQSSTSLIDVDGPGVVHIIGLLLVLLVSASVL